MNMNLCFKKEELRGLRGRKDNYRSKIVRFVYFLSRNRS